ncbi:MAG: pyruvate formate lyase family protein [Eubacteriales bacterium]
MNRTLYLKEKAFQNGKNPNNHTEQKFWVNKAILENPDEFAHNIKRAKIDCVLFDNYSIEIDKRELLVGRYSHSFKASIKQKAANLKGTAFRGSNSIYSGARLGETGHRVLDYEKLLNIGIKGILAEVESHLEELDHSKPEACEKKAFYLSVKISLEGVCRFAKRYYETLTALYLKELNPVRKEE